MPRRIALAIALALTVVTTFSIVVVGARTGLFNGKHRAEAKQEASVGLPAATALLGAPPAAQQEAAAPNDPIYVTEYIYRDEQAPAPQVRVGAAPSDAAPTAVPRPANTTVDPTQPDAAQPTQPPAAAPTKGSASPTSAPAVPPSAPASPTTAPAVPTTPSQPTAPPASAPGPSELEFTGTVTAINGSMVTFRHGGADTVVKVTINLSQLYVGSSVKVHAIWVASGYYVAKEIEFGEGN